MEIYLAIAGLFLSFFFAGSESAFTSFTKLRLEVWKRQEVKLAEQAVNFIEHPEKFYSTILIGNNLANILCSTYATIALIIYFNESTAWFIVTLAILFFGEIFPKTLFRLLADAIVLPVLFMVHVFYILFYPVIKILNYLIEYFFKLLGIKHPSLNTFYSREELELLLKDSHGYGVLDFFEQKYLNKLLSFNKAKVREAMIPRTEIVAVEATTSLDNLRNIMIESGKMRIPVYKKTLDNIIGVVFIHDMFYNDITLEKLIKPITMVPENKSCAHLLTEFKNQNISIAMVLDEHGGTAGMVTTDDLTEIVFGQFEDTEVYIPQMRALNNHTWVVDARINIDELSEAIPIVFPKGDYETMAGFILHKIGYIPNRNEAFQFHEFKVEIIDVAPNKINLVKIIRREGD
ncbi:MAG: DUF21 domain-containing protein [Caldithrix sp.]|nr:DUF21 domain-containing protein [Caldithrix sp.]